MTGAPAFLVEYLWQSVKIQVKTTVCCCKNASIWYCGNCGTFSQRCQSMENTAVPNKINR